MTDWMSVKAGAGAGTGAGEAGAGVPAGVLADAGAATAAFLQLADDTAAAPVQRPVAVAIAMAEAFLGQALILRGFEDVVVADGGWRRLANGPVRSIAGVTDLPTGAVSSVLPVAAYRIDIDGDARGWVSATGGAALVAVSYTAGLAADWASLPAPIAQGVVALAASLFADRAGGAVPSPGVIALWRPFRRLHLSEHRRGAPR